MQTHLAEVARAEIDVNERPLQIAPQFDNETTIRLSREVSVEKRGTKTNSSMPFLVLGLAPAFFLWRFHQQPTFAGQSKAEAYCLALEGSHLDCSRTLGDAWLQ